MNKENPLTIEKIVLVSVLLLLFSINVFAQNEQTLKAIQDQITSASNCSALAYDIELKNLDADEVFKDCVERRALMIAMIRKYGPEKYGEIDEFDKIEAYSYLSQSKNKLIQDEANSYSTAAGGN